MKYSISLSHEEFMLAAGIIARAWRGPYKIGDLLVTPFIKSDLNENIFRSIRYMCGWERVKIR